MATHLQGIEVQPEVAPAPQRAHGLPLRSAAIAGLALSVAVLVGCAVLLWMRHGVAIFFDTVAAGLATCF